MYMALVFVKSALKDTTGKNKSHDFVLMIL
jgi:hypothetical protein